MWGWVSLSYRKSKDQWCPSYSPQPGIFIHVPISRRVRTFVGKVHTKKNHFIFVVGNILLHIRDHNVIHVNRNHIKTPWTLHTSHPQVTPSKWRNRGMRTSRQNNFNWPPPPRWPVWRCKPNPWVHYRRRRWAGGGEWDPPFFIRSSSCYCSRYRHLLPWEWTNLLWYRW